MKKHTTITVSEWSERSGKTVMVDGELMKVTAVFGVVPYTLHVRAVTRWDRLRWKAKSWVAAPWWWIKTHLDPDWDYRFDDEDDERIPRNTLPYAIGGGAVLLAGIITLITSDAVYRDAIPPLPWFAGWSAFFVGGLTVVIAGVVQAIRDRTSRD